MFRVSELAGIAKDSISFAPGTVSFSLLSPRKAQHAGGPQNFRLKALPDAQLDPVACLTCYLDSTSSFRNAANSRQCRHLFISSVKPHKPVVGSTISGWIKRQLGDAGIDLAKFSAHSTRGAAASKAAASGVSVQSILELANWASESTFTRFYRRETELSTNQTVSDAILTVAGRQ